MKKLLMLGGSHFQVPAIKTARLMGHYVITCDYLEENPGHQYAHEYHNVSTTDKEAVLSLAKLLKIDGIVCYASDPAAPTAAYVAEKLGLPTNPYKSVDILSNKDLYRDFLAKNGFNVPKAKGYNLLEEAKVDFHTFKMPVMVKPVDSSGSKGVAKIDSIDLLEEKVDVALSFSRVKRFIIEEYVEKFGYQIAGDGFSVNGRLVFRCFANQHFEENSVNPFVPIGNSWPYNMPEYVHKKIHNEIQRALQLLEMKTGAYNFDIRIDNDENIYLMEIAPRNGGNLIPQVTNYATNVDMVEYTIKAALGEDCSNLTLIKPKGYWSCYVIHSEKIGVFKKMEVNEDFRKNNLIECKLFVKPGEKIFAFTGSNMTLGMMILKFESMDEMLEKMNTISSFVNITIY